jgi:DNA-binding MarR family transcriptional regulator
MCDDGTKRQPASAPSPSAADFEPDQPNETVRPSETGDVTAAARTEWIGSIIELVHAIDHAWQALATHAGLSLNELITLEHLYFSGPVSSPTLRRRTGLTASAVTSLIDRLEQRQLVRRVRPPQDRRVVLVELTDRGRPEAQALFEPLLQLLDQSAPSATPPALREQLNTISQLVTFFDYVAEATPILYRDADTR